MVSEAPDVQVVPLKISDVLDESSHSVLPGEAMADLDWDDEEEATNVFDRSASDLFTDLARKGGDKAPDARRSVGGAAALLMSSGRPAAPVAAKTQPAEPVLPKIPAPAPIPRDISQARFDEPPPARPPHPSWQPSVPPQAAQAQQGGSKSTLILAVVAVIVLVAAGFFYLRNATGPADIEISVTHNGESIDSAEI